MNGITERCDRSRCRLAGVGCEYLSASENWLGRPLCRKYVFAQFKALCVTVQDGGAAGTRGWYWALGMVATGQCEVLGAWPAETATARLISEDLKLRGVEHITTVSADDAIDFALASSNVACSDDRLNPSLLGTDSGAPVGVGVSVQPCAEGLHSKEAWLAVKSQIAAANVLSTRRARAVLSAVSTAERLQAGLARAIHRRAPFANDDDAINFVAIALSRAECRLERVRTGATTESRPYRSATASRPPASGFLSP